MSEEVSKSMHRLKNNQNDWDNLSSTEMNVWQKIAKKTRGWATVANGVTLFGSVAVVNGLYNFVSGRKLEGIAEVAIGRGSDVADGAIADYQGTKGKVGRALDPTMDVIQIGFALPLLVSGDVMPLIPALAMAAPKAVDVAATVTGTARGVEMNVTNEGKKSVFAMWAGIGAFMLKYTVDKHVPGIVDTGLEIAGWTGTVGGSIYHLPATKEYVQVGFGPNHSQEIA